MDKKEEILAAAVGLFIEKGYRFSMSELSAAVGIKTPSLYSHYESKEKIIELMMRRAFQNCRTELEDFTVHLSAGSCEERLKQLFRFLLDYFREGSRVNFLKNAMLTDTPALREICLSEIIRQNRWFTEVLSGYFREGAASGEILPESGGGTVYLYYSMIQGLLDVMVLTKNSDFDFQGYAEETWNAFWNGVRAR